MGGRPYAASDVNGIDEKVKKVFATADTDRDEKISPVEWNRAKPEWKWLFGVMDKDKDGLIDRREYTAFQLYKKQNPDWRNKLKPRP